MNIHNNPQVTKPSVEFLVPFTKILINHLSAPDISIEDFKAELEKIKVTGFVEKDGQIESISIINNFRVYVLYSGTRNFLLRIEGTKDLLGFCILLTNKGMNVNGDACIGSTPLANNLKDEFLENYKSPYLVTETFLNFVSR